MTILVTGAWKASEEELLAIEKMGHSLIIVNDERADLSDDARSAHAIICNALFLYHPIESFPNLRYIQLTSAGYDRVPMEYVREKGIVIHNARGVYSIPMAEFAVASVLSLYKKESCFFESKAARRWEKQRDLRELYGKTVCIVGCGSIGGECAVRFSAFGCRVLGVDVASFEDYRYENICGIGDLPELLPTVDILILTLPLTDSTYHLIGQKELALLPDGSTVVNVSRGAVIDTSALCAELESERLSAALDVFEEEPLPSESILWGLHNVILTPHNSFVGEGNAHRLWTVIEKNLKTL